MMFLSYFDNPTNLQLLILLTNAIWLILFIAHKYRDRRKQNSLTAELLNLLRELRGDVTINLTLRQPAKK